MPDIIDEIAQTANVSRGTVYRILTGKNKENWHSSRKRADEVRRIAAELGYRPNAAARSIREGTFRQIACVTTRLGSGHSPSLIGFLDYAADMLLPKDYLMVLESFRLDQATGEFIRPQRLFSDRSVDGVLAIISSGYCPESIEESLHELKLPTVWINHLPADSHCSVLSDEHDAIRDLMAHLHGLGHRKIVYFTPEYGHHSVAERTAAIVASATGLGIDVQVLSAHSGGLYIRDLVDRFFDRHREATAAVFFSRTLKDVFMGEAMRRGISVPGELSLAHFMTPNEESLFVEFPQTVIRLDHSGMIENGTELLFDMIESAENRSTVKRIPAQFISGETTGPVRR